MPWLLLTPAGSRQRPRIKTDTGVCRGLFASSFFFPPVCVLTSGRELFSVDDFSGVLLASAKFDAPAHHGEGSPGKHKKSGQGDKEDKDSCEEKEKKQREKNVG